MSKPLSPFLVLVVVQLLCILPFATAVTQKAALLVVDMQGCFLPGGPVGVTGEVEPVVAVINKLKDSGAFELVVWTQDWHPPNHVSFAPTHGKQPQDSLQLSYTCVRSKWLGNGPNKGPRLCNMTQLYPSSDHSVTCLSPHASQHSHSTVGTGRSNAASDAKGEADTAAVGADGSVIESVRAGSSAVAEGLHGVAAAAAGAAAQGIKLLQPRCPEPVTQVQQVLWPVHCVAYTAGARLHPGLHVSPQDLVVRKGWQPHIDAYSAFEDNGKLQSTGLAAQLRQQGIGRVVIAGVALDYCVLWSALDSAAEGFETVVVMDGTLPVTSQGAAAAVQQLHEAGVQTADSEEVLAHQGLSQA